MIFVHACLLVKLGWKNVTHGAGRKKSDVFASLAFAVLFGLLMVVVVFL